MKTIFKHIKRSENIILNNHLRNNDTSNSHTHFIYIPPSLDYLEVIPRHHVILSTFISVSISKEFNQETSTCTGDVERCKTTWLSF